MQKQIAKMLAAQGKIENRSNCGKGLPTKTTVMIAK